MLTTHHRFRKSTLIALACFVVQASASLSPGWAWDPPNPQVPLEDAHTFTVANVFSPAVIPGLDYLPMILPGGAVGNIQTLSWMAQYYPRLRAALALAEDSKRTILFGDFPSYKLVMNNPTVVSIWTMPMSMDLVQQTYAQFSQVQPGAIVASPQQAGWIQSINFNTLPTATSSTGSPSSSIPRVCWEQPLALYSAYGNALDMQPSVVGGEGPRPKPDPHVWPMPGDLCNPS